MAVSGNGSISETKRIAQFMGLPSWNKIDDIGLVECVRKGFPARTTSIVVKRIDPDGMFVRDSDIIPKSTLHRRKDQTLTKDESEKVLALSRVFLEVLRVYDGDVDRTARFLVQAHPILGSRSPIKLALESTAGADLVMKLLAQADAGVAV
jgi:putative toxin-antitoxin system antitoxin component (TIGR02293 family)